MRRRDFIIGIAGSAATWPLAARAQQAERMRRVGVISGAAETDQDFQTRYAALRQALEQLGWTEGRNIRFDHRLGSAGNIDLARRQIGEIVASAPDVIVATGSPVVGALQQATRTIPIVFVGVADPVGAGFAASLARPGGNTTGFTAFEYGISAKWLELLKEFDPRLTRAAVLRDPYNPAGIGQMAAMQGAAGSLRVEMSPIKCARCA